MPLLTFLALRIRRCKKLYKNNTRTGITCAEYNYTSGVMGTSDNDEAKEKCRDKKECVKQHNYYQWVPFLFIFQGLLSILPSTIWRHLEGRKMSAISTAVTTANK